MTKCVLWTDEHISELKLLLAAGHSAATISRLLPCTKQQIYSFLRMERDKDKPVVKKLIQPVIDYTVKCPPNISAAVHFNKHGCRLTKINGYLQLDGKRISYGQVIELWKAEVS